MARIVKPAEETKTTCKHCRYEVAFEPADITEGKDPEDRTPYRYGTCPNDKCGRRIDLPIPGIPDFLDL